MVTTSRGGREARVGVQRQNGDGGVALRILTSTDPARDLATLDLRLVHIPARTVISFERRASTLGDASATSVAALAASVRSRTALRMVIQTATSEGTAARRIDAIRTALVMGGVEDARIATTVLDSVEDDQVVLIVERQRRRRPEISAGLRET